MRENKKASIEFSLRWEGVKSFDKAGGDTWYGIARKMHPDLASDEAWNKFTSNPQNAINLLDSMYWTGTGCDNLPAPLDSFSYDAAVNLGPGWVHETLGKTQDPIEFNKERREHYLLRIRQKPELLKYKNGWFNRVQDLEKTFPVKEVKKPMYNPKTTLTGSGVALGWVLAFVLKHYLNIDVPDEVTYGIIAIGFALMGKFSRDSNKITDAHDDAMNAAVKTAVEQVSTQSPNS